MKASSAISKRSSTDLATPWAWKTRFDEFLLPADMSTGHLFNTLRMIWNNTVPPHMRVGAVKLYRFGSFYTRDYMKQAVRHIGTELLRRPDLTPAQKRQLAEMESWCCFAEFTEVSIERLPAPQLLLT